MRKLCMIDECSNFVFSKGYCLTHAKQFLYNKPINKISDKQREKNIVKKENTKLVHLSMYEFWKSFGEFKRCQSCNKRLSNEFSTINVDHLLEKSKYPELATNKDNFFLVCESCHELKTNGFPTEKHKIAIENVKKKLL